MLFMNVLLLCSKCDLAKLFVSNILSIAMFMMYGTSGIDRLT